jgi:hypothetical protein
MFFMLYLLLEMVRHLGRFGKSGAGSGGDSKINHELTTDHTDKDGQTGIRESFFRSILVENSGNQPGNGKKILHLYISAVRVRVVGVVRGYL